MAETMIARGIGEGAYESRREVSISSMVLMTTSKGPLGFGKTLKVCVAEPRQGHRIKRAKTWKFLGRCMT